MRVFCRINLVLFSHQRICPTYQTLCCGPCTLSTSTCLSRVSTCVTSHSFKCFYQYVRIVIKSVISGIVCEMYTDRVQAHSNANKSASSMLARKISHEHGAGREVGWNCQ